MSHIKRSLVSSGVVLLCVGAVWAGNHRRTWVDTGGGQDIGQIDSATGSASAEDWVAANGPVTISETRYFKEVADILKYKYVDPVTDDQKLVDGAIRGMIVSLNDPNSIYMDADEFRAFCNARVGKYEGIGAELVLSLGSGSAAGLQSGDDALADPTDIRIPKLLVALVVPGGPADQAGVKVGDVVDEVDGKWVINAAPLQKLRSLQTQVQKGKAPASALNKLRQELREKTKASMLPARAKDRLMIGAKGTISVKWMRNGTILATNIAKGRCELPAEAAGDLRLRFVPGAASKLQSAIRGRTSVTIDLRGNVMGDMQSMRQCLALLAPAGTYGYVTREQGDGVTPLALASGNPKPPKTTLLVDSNTRNVAEIFALALSSKGLAKLSGTAMAGDRTVCEVVGLQGGGGYTLATGKFTTTKPAKAKIKPKKVAMGDEVGTSPVQVSAAEGWVCAASRRQA